MLISSFKLPRTSLSLITIDQMVNQHGQHGHQIHLLQHHWPPGNVKAKLGWVGGLAWTCCSSHHRVTEVIYKIGNIMSPLLHICNLRFVFIVDRNPRLISNAAISWCHITSPLFSPMFSAIFWEICKEGKLRAFVSTDTKDCLWIKFIFLA